MLMTGTEGIAVGMATKILLHNLPEIWEAQIDILEKEKFRELYPDFAQGGHGRPSEHEDGAGKIELRAKIEPAGPQDRGRARDPSARRPKA
ncbi:MAG: DNA gyrase subunit A [Myxococcota bacterium]